MTFCPSAPVNWYTQYAHYAFNMSDYDKEVAFLEQTILRFATLHHLSNTIPNLTNTLPQNALTCNEAGLSACKMQTITHAFLQIS